MNFLHLIKDFASSFYDKHHQKHEINRTLLGGVLYFIGLGGVSSWGNLNLYFFSYFKNRANLTSPNQSNLIISVLAIPVAIISIVSIQTAEKVGFKKIIVISSLVYSLSTFCACFTQNYYIFTLLYNLLPSIAIGFSMNPAIYCVWTCGPEIKGKIAGYMFGFFQLSSLFYILIATLIVNPNNKSATIRIVQENQTEYSYYDEEVAKNVPKMVMVLGIIYFTFSFLGSYLIKPLKLNEIEKDKNTQKAVEKELKAISSESPLGLEINPLAEPKYEVFLEGKNNISSNTNEVTSECPDINSAIKTRTFIIMFFNSILIAAFVLYLHINFKIFSITRLNNDYYVTYLYMFNAIIGGIGRFFWGHMIDKYSFKKIFIVLEVVVFINGLFFPFVTNAFLYCFMILCIAFFDGGLIAIMGPALINIYGLNVGAKILPIKGLAFFLGLMICPLIGFLLENKIGIEKVFFILGAQNIIGVILAFFIKMKYQWYVTPKEKINFLL